jgi:hypothetical protein
LATNNAGPLTAGAPRMRTSSPAMAQQPRCHSLTSGRGGRPQSSHLNRQGASRATVQIKKSERACAGEQPVHGQAALRVSVIGP